jgi:hypothetical protein
MKKVSDMTMTTLRRNTSEKELTHTEIIQNYARAYKLVNNREPHIMHLTAEWYRVNGEIVHRLTLLGEITRLRHLAQKQKMINADKSVIQRLIAKLRSA